MNLGFDKQERNAIYALTVVIALLLTFWELFGEAVTVATFLGYIVFFLAAALVAVFLHELGHKIAAHFVGYHARIESTTNGLLASAAVITLSFARIPVFTPNRLSLDADPRRRMTKTRSYDNPAQQAYVAIGGTIGSIVAITLLRALAEITGYVPFATAQWGVVLHALYSMIPFELISVLKLKYFTTLDETVPSDGMHVIRSSTPLWIFIFMFIIFFAGIANIPGTSGFALSALLAAMTTVAYAYFVN